MKASPSRRAFTLVELLVVIGIIALLISILLPALGRVRAQSLQVKCAANLKTIGTVVQLYTMQARSASGKLDVLPTPGSHNSFQPLKFEFQPFVTKAAPGTENKIMYCTVLGAGIHNSQNQRDNFAGTDGEEKPLYGYNPWLGPTYGWNTFVPISRIKSPSTMVVFADAWDNQLYRFGQPNGGWTPDRFNTTFNYRHNFNANVLFLDGHVESFKDEKPQAGSSPLPQRREARLWPDKAVDG